MRKRLLLIFTCNQKRIGQAINCLGTRVSLTVFLPFCDYKLYDVNEIRFDRDSFYSDSSKYVELLRKDCYDEAYLLLEGDERDMERDAFMRSLNCVEFFYIFNDKFPVKSMESAKSIDSMRWVLPFKCKRSLFSLFQFCNIARGMAKIRKKNSGLIPIYAILGTYNEGDIVYATVKNALYQGCEKVFIIDNGSSDDTVSEAVAAGAILYKSFETDYYDELLRIRIMNDAVEEISESSGLDQIWWLWLDADEFPTGPGGMTIKEYIENYVPDECRIIGANFINHLPVNEPYYIKRFHPFDFMPYGELYDTARFKVKHCLLRHWKHNMHKYVRGKPPIRAKSGFHMGYCGEKLYEPEVAIDIHHFPFREKESTYRRYLNLCRGSSARNAFNDKMSPGGKSSITKRFENLGHIYSGNWDKVSFTPETEERRGVKLTRYSFKGPRWYSLEELDSVIEEFKRARRLIGVK